MTGVAGVIVTAGGWVPVLAALVALWVTVEAPAVVGVPEMRPVVALSARPAGNPVAPKLVGLFVAERGYVGTPATSRPVVPPSASNRARAFGYRIPFRCSDTLSYRSCRLSWGGRSQ